MNYVICDRGRMKWITKQFDPKVSKSAKENLKSVSKTPKDTLRGKRSSVP